MNSIRQPAVAGLFYPSNQQELTKEVEQYLHQAVSPAEPLRPKAIIVPHAGYIYSGSTAAKAYVAIADRVDSITRVVLLGPAHRVTLRGLAVMDIQQFRTPLGDIPQDSRSINQLLTLPQVQVLDAAHWQEHSLEVQLPFLQTVLNEFTLVPIVIGDSSPSEVDQALEILWGGPETLIVISSDLSHFHNYQTAQAMDSATCHAIEQLDLEAIDHQHACGATGIQGLLRVAKRREMNVSTLALCNSGDTAGDRERVVGYGSWTLSESGDNHAEQQ